MRSRISVLLIHRYYWPDETPCSKMMRVVANHLSSKGYSVDVISSQPSYRERSLSRKFASVEIDNGVKVRRLKLPYEKNNLFWRIGNALYMGFWILFKALTQKYDVIIATSTPPILGGFFSALAAKLTYSRFIYFVMDLHPEIGQVSGDFSNPGLFYSLQRIDDWNCRKADPVLVHSEDMVKTFRSRSRGSEYKIQIMNNFALPSEKIPGNIPRRDFEISNSSLTLIYAGNIGRFQGLGPIVDAMGLIADRKDIVLLMIGDGVLKPALQDKARKVRANIRFFDYQSVEIAKLAIQNADIGLVSLLPETYKYAYPGKTMAYLEQGRPIIAAVEPESELVRYAVEQGYGFSVPIGDAAALASLLKKLANNDSWKHKMKEAALQKFQQDFSADVVLKRWFRVVKTGSVV